MAQSENSSNPDLNKFLYPHSHYRGEFTPQNLAFNANLQEFAQRVSYVCALETNGKVTSAEAYKQIKHLYKQLKGSKKGLGINSEPPPENPDEGTNA